MHATDVNPEPVAVSFPDFLDDRRLPQLHAAWEAYEAPAQDAAKDLPVADSDTAKPIRDISMIAARFAMERLASHDEAVVRRRAEELSRRFGADETPGVVAVTASIEEDAPARPSAQADISKATQVAAVPEASAESATPPAAEATADVSASEASPEAVATDDKPDLGTKYSLAAPMPLDRPPPIPLRRSAPAAYDPPPAEPKKAIARTRPATASRTARRRNPAIQTEDNGNSIASFLPTQLFSFGWNTQPD
jgi:hypothetical protein